MELFFSLDIISDDHNLKGFVFALLASVFIGASFIIKKKGLRRAAANSGVRAGVGGFFYLLEPLWWLGRITSKLWALSCFFGDLRGIFSE